MTQFFQIHPETPQLRLIKQAAQILHSGGIIALPTDACYVLACQIDNKDAAERLRRLRGIDDRHHLTLLCRDLSEIALYAKVDNKQYRVLKSATPGPFTVILEATREVPRRLSHPSRKTIGLRIPENAIAQALLETLGQPLLSSSLILPGEDDALTDAEQIRERLDRQIDLIIDGGACSLVPTTLVDLTNAEPQLLRSGMGEPRVFGLQA